VGEEGSLGGDRTPPLLKQKTPTDAPFTLSKEPPRTRTYHLRANWAETETTAASLPPRAHAYPPPEPTPSRSSPPPPRLVRNPPRQKALDARSIHSLYPRRLPLPPPPVCLLRCVAGARSIARSPCHRMPTPTTHSAPPPLRLGQKPVESTAAFVARTPARTRRVCRVVVPLSTLLGGRARARCWCRGKRRTRRTHSAGVYDKAWFLYWGCMAMLEVPGRRASFVVVELQQ